jgi:O-antigen/teichoic acid export membrane protein
MATRKPDWLVRMLAIQDVRRGAARSGVAALADGRTLAYVAYKTIADGLSKLVSLVITVGAARQLSSADFGVLALAMTTGWLLSVASDAGLPLYLAKRLARSAAAGERASFAPVAEVLRIRGVLGTIGAAAGLAIATIVAPASAFFAFWIVIVAQLLNAVLETLAHAYRGLQRSDIESTLVVSQRVVTAAAAILALWWSPSLLLLATALVMPPAVALAVSMRTARHLLSSDGDERPTETAAQQPSPLSHVAAGLGILISAIYFRCDVFFIERWHGLEAVGTYNAAFRIVEALRLFPAAVLAVSYPRLCTANDGKAVRSLLIPLVASALVVAGAVYLFAPLALGRLYGPRFVEGAPALETLALAIPFFFANYALTHQVIAWDGQRAYLGIATAALAANVIGNIILIPGLGMRGAALSTLATEVVVGAGCLVALGHLRVRLVAPLSAQPRSRGIA